MTCPDTSPPRPTPYQLRIEGHFDDHRRDWLEALTLTHQADGTAILSGLVADQAALHGLLTKVRDIGATLLSVEALESPA